MPVSMLSLDGQVLIVEPVQRRMRGTVESKDIRHVVIAHVPCDFVKDGGLKLHFGDENPNINNKNELIPSLWFRLIFVYFSFVSISYHIVCSNLVQHVMRYTTSVFSFIWVDFFSLDAYLCSPFNNMVV